VRRHFALSPNADNSNENPDQTHHHRRKLWRIKLQRPPTRTTHDGLCVKDDRTIYIHPDAINARGIELVTHEIVHARLFDLDEDCVDEIGRLVSEVCHWVARHNDGIQ
jgi:hypothetical protein